MTGTSRKLLASLLAALVSAALYGASLTKIPILDEQADRYFSEAIGTATLAYAIKLRSASHSHQSVRRCIGNEGRY